MYGHVVTDFLYPHLCQPSSIVIKAQEVWWKYVKSLDFNLNFCKDLLMSNKFVNKCHCLLVESKIIKIPHAEDKNPFTKRLFCFFALHFYVGLQVYKKKKTELLIPALKTMDVWSFLKTKNKALRLFWHNLFALFHNNQTKIRMERNNMSWKIIKIHIIINC